MKGSYVLHAFKGSQEMLISNVKNALIMEKMLSGLHLYLF
jgi:hypothetical protein